MKKKLRSCSPSDEDPLFDQVIYVDPARVHRIDDYVECLYCGSDNTAIYDDGDEDTIGLGSRTSFVSANCMDCGANIYGTETSVVEDVAVQPVYSFNRREYPPEPVDPSCMSTIRERYIKCLSCGTGHLEGDDGEIEIQDNTMGSKTEITEDVVGYCPVCKAYTLHTQYYELEDLTRHKTTKLQLLFNRVKKHFSNRRK